jgi:hypothetical protein
VSGPRRALEAAEERTIHIVAGRGRAGRSGGAERGYKCLRWRDTGTGETRVRGGGDRCGSAQDDAVWLEG